MTEFNRGDRVQYTKRVETGPFGWRTGNTGTVIGPWEHLGVLVRWEGDTADSRHYTSDLTKVETPAPVLDFVGPRPEPVPGPKVVLPLSADEGFIEDNNGAHIGQIESNNLTDEEDQALADLIVKLLNKHFEEN